MKVQFLLLWCVERGLSVCELSPLSRNVHQEHGKYNIHLTIIQESNSIVIKLLKLCTCGHTCMLYMHITFRLSCNYERVYVIFLSLTRTF